MPKRMSPMCPDPAFCLAPVPNLHHEPRLGEALERSTRGASRRKAEVPRKHLEVTRKHVGVNKSDRTKSKMWTEPTNKSNTVVSSSKMVDPNITRQLLHTVLQRNGSTAAATRPSCTENSTTRTSGIIPGAIAATVFITFILALYALLWKCMVSSPQRKHSKVRVRLQQRTSA